MPIAGSRSFVPGLLAGTLLAASMWSGAAFAYTPEQQQACTPDAMRLCGSYVPDVDRITVCMIQNKSQLSPGRRVYFRAEPEPVAAVGRPMAVKPVAPKSTRPKKPVKPET